MLQPRPTVVRMKVCLGRWRDASPLAWCVLAVACVQFQSELRSSSNVSSSTSSTSNRGECESRIEQKSIPHQFADVASSSTSVQIPQRDSLVSCTRTVTSSWTQNRGESTQQIESESKSPACSLDSRLFRIQSTERSVPSSGQSLSSIADRAGPLSLRFASTAPADRGRTTFVAFRASTAPVPVLFVPSVCLRQRLTSTSFACVCVQFQFHLRSVQCSRQNSQSRSLSPARTSDSLAVRSVPVQPNSQIPSPKQSTVLRFSPDSVLQSTQSQSPVCLSPARLPDSQFPDSVPIQSCSLLTCAVPQSPAILPVSAQPELPRFSPVPVSQSASQYPTPRFFSPSPTRPSHAHMLNTVYATLSHAPTCI
ncbi:hypothetical protein B0H67DRAFT_136531 [Lasiosphaeris hirsuta]|uniref:Uncharacterized protein n=1 Tax=Lasiosphaeris hirsuta TaxID=260670 RepID=A0AA40B0W6_9PEZI|nr:hypothetical protein B0H67DRAFT_136531 [Lasiosphaeris hirsuta]